ncbi:MAG: hypothetical protein IJ570_07430 [Prevotella sp.]|nr:hypothetical protein [Prevotella sp.]
MNQKNENGQEPKVEVVIKRHKQLFDLLNHPKEMWKVLFLLFLIIVIVFIGLAFVVLTIKRIYPYNVIETNLQGASIVKNEDKDVIYWLFNSADLWANSGIEVKEGDELTIRASGASYTAIHHLVAASKDNKIPEDKWVDTEGQRKTNDRDLERGKYRISPTSVEGILLMQVIPSNFQNNSDDWLSNDKTKDYLVNGQIEIIGKERRNLRISQDGVLHFAVNDIVLTDSVLKLMYEQFINEVSRLDTMTFNTDSIFKLFDKLGSGDREKDSLILDTLITKSPKVDTDFQTKVHNTGLQFGYYPSDTTEIACKAHNAYPIVNELVYYKQHRFRDPWYVDNIGSFLIVIERKR